VNNRGVWRLSRRSIIPVVVNNTQGGFYIMNNIRIIPIEDGGNPRTQFDIRKEEGE